MWTPTGIEITPPTFLGKFLQDREQNMNIYLMGSKQEGRIEFLCHHTYTAYSNIFLFQESFSTFFEFGQKAR